MAKVRVKSVFNYTSNLWIGARAGDTRVFTIPIMEQLMSDHPAGFQVVEWIEEVPDGEKVDSSGDQKDEEKGDVGIVQQSGEESRKVNKRVRKPGSKKRLKVKQGNEEESAVCEERSEVDVTVQF